MIRKRLTATLILLAATTWSNVAASDKTPSSSLVISATRYGMAEEEVSGNITVITKEEISNLPVHDLGEALNYTTGLVFDRNGGAGSPVMPSIQGSEYRHIKILLDDIPMEFLSEGLADLSIIPLENIERVEVLKGSASAVWGSSLGGVINIITRSPSEEPTGDIGISIGEKNTRRYNGLISGKTSGIGYLLSASRFETDGFFANQDAEIGNLYGKLMRGLGANLKAELSYGYNNSERGFGEFPLYGFFSDGKSTDSYGRAELTYTPQQDADLSLSLYKKRFDGKREDTLVGNATPFGIIADREDTAGLTAKFGWRHSDKGVVSAGVEGSEGELDFKHTDTLFSLDERLSKKIYKSAAYANESYGLGNWTINVGARYDDDSVFGSEVSPAGGVVYNIKEVLTLLRLNIARGFTPPPLTYRFASNAFLDPNPDLEAERSWSYQAGIESGYLQFLRGKVTFYRTEIADAIDVSPDLNASGKMYWKNFEEFRRQGVEVEARTAEYKGLALSYGYAFNDVKDLDTDKVVKGKPRITHDVSLEYRGPFEAMGTLKGHYIWWNAPDTPPNDYNARDKKFIWDVKVSKYLARWKSVMGEIFVSVHNITDDKQYLMEIYPNPERWVEAGVSLAFY